MSANLKSFLTLLLLSTAMLIGSFLAGNIPMAFHLHEDSMLLMSSFGSGLLVGTALIVIVPEGVHSVYLSSSVNSKHSGVSITPIPAPKLDDRSNLYPATDDDLSLPYAKRSTEHQHNQAHEQSFDSTESLPSYVGMALVSGFALMFLIDQVSHDQGHHRHSHVAISDLRGSAAGAPGSSTTNPKKRISASIGMIVHAASDGIALGAAAASGTSAVKVIVFIAIILHKAPSAFGLTTFLLHDGASRKATQRYLLAFSCAAPITSILTFLTLQQTSLGLGGNSEFYTGLLLLFSGGTFLYVATVHILPEVYAGGSHSHGGNRSPGGLDPYFEHKHISRGQIFCILAGLFLPMLLNMGHSH